jgi:hypothetical protein
MNVETGVLIVSVMMFLSNLDGTTGKGKYRGI